MITVRVFLFWGVLTAPILLFSNRIESTPEEFNKEAVTKRLESIPQNRAKIQYLIDNFYKIYSNDFQTAIDFNHYAIRLANETGLKDEEGYCWKNIGVVLYLRGDYEKALVALLRSSTLFDSLDSKKGIAAVNNELAVFYNKQKEIEKAHAALDKAEKAATEIGDHEALSVSLHHRGTFLSRNGKYEEAKPYFDEVLKTRIQLKDSVGIGYVLLDLAEYELYKNNLESAIGFINKSTEIRTLIGDRQGVAVNTIVIGESYFNVGDYRRAIEYFESGIEQAKVIGFTDLIRFAHDLLQQCFVNLGDYKKAYENLAQSKFFEDSLFNLEKTKFISELQTKYETEQKEQRILVQNAQLERQEAQLRTGRILTIALALLSALIIVIAILLVKRAKLKQEKILAQEKALLHQAQVVAAITSQESERKRFARDLHDGFGQMISVLNINLKSLEKNSVDRVAIFESSSRVLSEMYKELKSICFNLMPESLIKSGVVDALSEFANRINLSNQVRVKIESFGINTRLTDLQEINIYRISQEWINNILKYSDATVIHLQLTKDESEITLTIEDNGIGFEKDLLTEGKGNGWKNIQSRTNLLKGDVDLDTSPGRRTNTLVLNIPIQRTVEVSEQVS